MQTSISAWLKKPAAVKALPEPSNNIAVESIPSAKADTGIPTPPPEEPASHKRDDGAQKDRVEQQTARLYTVASHARPLHPNITITACTPSLLPGLKRLNALHLPIPYPPRFYAEILSDSTASSITLLATWNDSVASPAVIPAYSAKAGRGAQQEPAGTVVSAIRCRLLTASSPSADTHAGAQKPTLLYISTLATLSPYQNLGLASRLLETVIQRAVEQHGVREVGAHVWDASEEALDWYRRRGFKVVGREEGYYRRLEPKGASVVRLLVG